MKREKPTIVKCWVFKSSSGDGRYQTLLYDDGKTSCECKGWTRRVDALGNRSCKHTRSVDLNSADIEAESFWDYSGWKLPEPVAAKPHAARRVVEKAERATPAVERVFKFD